MPIRQSRASWPRVPGKSAFSKGKYAVQHCAGGEPTHVGGFDLINEVAEIGEKLILGIQMRPMDHAVE